MKKIYPIDIKELIFHSTYDVREDYEEFFKRDLTNSEFDEISKLLISLDLKNENTSYDISKITELRDFLSRKLGGCFIEL